MLGLLEITSGYAGNFEQVDKMHQITTAASIKLECPVVVA